MALCSGLALAACLVACGAAAPGAGLAPPRPVDGHFGRVEAGLAPAGRVCLGPDAAAELVSVVAQGARDWLEHADRLAPDGAFEIRIEIDSLALRSRPVAWLFAWAAPPDHLTARVAVTRRGVPVSGRRVRVESALAGYSWRDPAERLERLARRLGRRVAEGV